VSKSASRQVSQSARTRAYKANWFSGAFRLPVRQLARAAAVAAVFTVALAGRVLRAQIVPAHPPAHTPVAAASVAFLFPEQIAITAGKPSVVALHFRVAQGMHINSHVPSSNFLIPTTLTFPSDPGVRFEATIYPDGSEITLPIDPSTKLSVYTGEFVIHARLIADAGEHSVQAKLHYQACNDNECLPPKTIVVPIDVIGK
jgi:hypothetical protein